jgi:Zn-dependent protease with chaperone function
VLRWIIALALLLAGSAPRADENIVDVLVRSHQARLNDAHAADPTNPRTATVRASFETLTRTLGITQPVELRVIPSGALAETLQGRVVVVNQSLADLTEGERLFVLAHELGHVELRHWDQTERLYLKWIPGVVTPDQTEPVAALLGRDASGLAHRQEFEADAYGLRALHALGRGWEDAYSVFMREGVTHDTATHPSTRKRLALLRDAEAKWSGAAASQAATRNEPMASPRRAD